MRSALGAVGPPPLFGLRLWASVCLALYVTFWLQLDNGFWAGTSAALVCQPRLGASLRKGWYRMIGTIVGAVAIVVLTACFPQQRAPFLIGLALWGAASAFVATVFSQLRGVCRGARRLHGRHHRERPARGDGRPDVADELATGSLRLRRLGSPPLAWPIPLSPAWMVTAGTSRESTRKIVLLMSA